MSRAMRDEVRAEGTRVMANPRRGLMLLVAVGLALELVVAGIAFTAPRPERFGWQMYSGVPYVPRAWATADGTERPIDFDASLINMRAEIDYLSLVRDRGCHMAEADEVRIELMDGSFERVECP